MRRRILQILFLIAFTIGAFAVKVYVEGRIEFRKAGEAYAKAQKVEMGTTEEQRAEWELAWDDAMDHYERAIKWYVPRVGYVPRSLEKLWEIGERMEAAGERLYARKSYEKLRSALYAVRSTYTPYPEWIERCDGKISTLMAMEPPYSEDDKRKSFEQRKEEHYKLLKKDYAPDVFWSIVAVSGFFGWIGCVFGFIWFAMEESGKLRRRRALGWSGAFVLCYALWIVGLLRA
ncbi:MAG: hypothetical protein HYT87_07710 [Nitrospirae bacterium]|nr:hypothetical protein [Nitrospirota bacterium]